MLVEKDELPRNPLVRLIFGQQGLRWESNTAQEIYKTGITPEGVKPGLRPGPDQSIRTNFVSLSQPFNGLGLVPENGVNARHTHRADVASMGRLE
jgi:hypothetical protein